jgi:hypothetical protein
MIKLNVNEIKVFAESLEKEYELAKDTVDTMYEQKEKGNYRLEATTLNSVEDYIREYENNWYTYTDFSKCVESEKDQGSYWLTEQQCIELINEAIFELPCGSVIQTVY